MLFNWSCWKGYFGCPSYVCVCSASPCLTGALQQGYFGCLSQEPSKFTRLGGKLPKGILLTGSPGTGKLCLQRLLRERRACLSFTVQEFEEMFVGVVARRLRSLFQAAKKKAPCIVFIDEIDVVASYSEAVGRPYKENAASVARRNGWFLAE